MTRNLPNAGSTPDAEQAIRYADWWLRTALDRMGHDGRKYHPTVIGRLWCANAALHPAVAMAKPEHDQIVLEDA